MIGPPGTCREGAPLQFPVADLVEDRPGHEQSGHPLVGLDLTPVAPAICEGDVALKAAKNAWKRGLAFLVVREEGELIHVLMEQRAMEQYVGSLVGEGRTPPPEDAQGGFILIECGSG